MIVDIRLLLNSFLITFCPFFYDYFPSGKLSKLVNKVIERFLQNNLKNLQFLGSRSVLLIQHQVHRTTCLILQVNCSGIKSMPASDQY